MNWLIIGIATFIFIMLMWMISHSFFRQYPMVLMAKPKLFKFEKVLFLIPTLMGLVVTGLTVLKGINLLHVYGVGIYQKDQIRISASMTIVSIYFLLFLMWTMGTMLFAFGKESKITLKLWVIAVLLSAVFALGCWMAMTLDLSLFNGITA